MRKSKLIWVAVLVVLVMAPATAFAALAKVGPVVPYIPGPPASGNGFPKYYLDSTGAAADIQVPPFGVAANKGVVIPPPTMNFTAPETTGAPNQFSRDIGFDLECFYWGIVPDPKGFDPTVWGSVGKFRTIIGLECGFTTANPLGAAVNGNQGVFQRVRIDWVAVPQAGFYVFRHPYGVENIKVTAAEIGVKGLNLTIDTPLITNIPPGNFNVALTGPIGPFLSQVNPPVQISNLIPPIPAPYNLPTDWFGDGVSVATFTGSPIGFNQFQFEAWQDSAHTIALNLFKVPLGQPGAGTITNIMTTNLATIYGHRYRIPVTGAYELLLLD